MPVLRIDKIIASTGDFSRQEVKKLVASGKVMIDGNPVKRPDLKADTGSSVISVCGNIIRYREHTYLMMYKPQGVVTSTKDPVNKTVMDLLPEKYSRKNLSPHGRLDKDSEGLLLISDDGELAHRLLSPSRHVDKKYFIKVDGALGALDTEKIKEGITLSDGYKCMPALLEICATDPDSAYITIREGKFHQVKRMMDALGKQVIFLKRIQMGSLVLDESLTPGTFRELTENEINNLKKL